MSERLPGGCDSIHREILIAPAHCTIVEHERGRLGFFENLCRSGVISAVPHKGSSKEDIQEAEHRSPRTVPLVCEREFGANRMMESGGRLECDSDVAAG